jgi:hypothetical protein
MLFDRIETVFLLNAVMLWVFDRKKPTEWEKILKGETKRI